MQYNTVITLNSSYDDQSTLDIQIGNDGNTANDYCYFDDLEVFGEVITTQAPTQNPMTNPTVKPTNNQD